MVVLSRCTVGGDDGETLQVVDLECGILSLPSQDLDEVAGT